MQPACQKSINWHKIEKEKERTNQIDYRDFINGWK
jgi:hypothetical protein